MSKTRMGKRVASLLLSLVMMLSLLPTTVYATGADDVATYSVDDTSALADTEGTGEPGSTGEDKDGSEAGNEGETSVTYVAQVGETQYATLEAAIDAATAGQTVTLLANVNENVEIAKEKNLTLDLNGFTLNGGTGTNKAALTNYGTITITDSSEDKTGTIKRDDIGTVGETSYYVILNQGTMTIESGNVINNSGYKKANSTGSMVGSSLICNGDCNGGSTLTINGGTFTQYNFIAIKNGALGVLNVTGGMITSNHSAIQNWFEANITGGEIKGQLWTDAYTAGVSDGKTKIGGNATFTGEIVMDIYGNSVAPTLEIAGGKLDVTNWKITDAAANVGAKPAISGGTFKAAVPADYLADGFEIKESTDASGNTTYGVEKAASYVAMIGEKGYDTLEEAINATATGDTVTLLADVDLGGSSVSFYNKKDTSVCDLTFDLNGHTITSAIGDNGTVLAAREGLVIKNGAIVNTSESTNKKTSAICVTSKGTTTIENVTVTSKVSGVYICQLTSTGAEVVNVESGTFISGEYGVYIANPKGSTTKSPVETLNINGGTINGTHTGVYAKGAESGSRNAVVNVNITAGTVSSVGVYGAKEEQPVNLTVSGGTISDKLHIDNLGGKALVTGGAVKGAVTNNGTLTISGGTFNGDLTNKTNGSITISGGTFTTKPNETYLADGYVFAANADGTFSVKAGAYVAEVNGTGYETLAAAIKAAESGDTVTLLADVNLDSAQTISKQLTLDLNGKTISSTAYRTIQLNAGADLTVKDSAIGGKIANTYTGSAYPATIYLNAASTKFTLESGTIESDPNETSLQSVAINSAKSKDCEVNIKGGSVTVPEAATKGRAIVASTNSMTLNISGGTIAGGLHGVDAYSGSTVNITGGEITARYVDTGVIKEAYGMRLTGTANVTVAGGTITGVKMDDDGYNLNVPAVKLESGEIKGSFYSVTKGTITFTVAENADIVLANDSAEKFLPNEVKLVQNADDTYGIKKTTYVAEVNGTQYISLQAAIDAAVRNATVKMLANTRENVTISKNLTLDLNGFTLNGGTVKATPALKVDNARVTVKDSSEVQTGTIMREDTAENSGVSSHYVIDIQGKQSKSLLTFESGTVKNNSGNTEGKGASLVRVGDDSVKEYPGLTIKGGTFTQDNFIAIKVDRGTLYLNDGKVNSVNSYAIENWHHATIRGGTVNGAVAAWTYSGGYNSDLTISGGTINGDVTSVNYGNAEDRTATVTITGGTVTGELGAYTYNDNDGSTAAADATMATIKVTGGTFDIDPTKYVVESSKVTKNSEGKYGVEKAYLAKVGDTSYYTMKEAFEAQTASGAPIVMLRDYTTGSPFRSGSINRTVDLNGHTWTCTGTDANSAAFEINNSNVTLTVKSGKVVSSQLVGLIPSAIGGTITYDNSGLVFESVEMKTTAHSGIETNGNNKNNTVTLKNSTLNVPNGFGIYFPSSGTLNIENSIINAKTMGVQVCSGSLNINDGSEITVTGDPVEKTENDGAIQDGAAISIVNRTGYKGLDKIKVTGGTFTAKTGNDAIKAYDWANNTATDFTANDKVFVSGGTFSSAVPEGLCAAGYIPTKNADDTYGVKKGQYVARVNFKEKYETLQEAIDAITSSSGKVRLLADVELNGTVVIPAGKTVTLNLKAHKITAAGTALLTNGKLEIQDLDDNGGTIESTGNVAVAVGNNATVVVYSGTLKGREGAVITGKSTGATIEIRGSKATLIATDNAVIAGNGSERDGKSNTIKIMDGTFEGSIKSDGYIACGIYAPWNDNVTVSGGTFNITNGAGIVARAGTVKVTGGTFKCTGDGTGWVGDNKNQIPCAALVFDKAANYPALTADSQILVSGGKFSTDPAANGATLADGFEPKQGEDGMYTLVASDPVAAANGVGYATLGKAIAAAQATAGGATITLLKDINTSSYYEVKGANPVTIDLNNHNITGSGATGLFYVTAKGDLTITGNGVITAVENNKAAMAVWVYSPTAKVTLAGGTYKQAITNTADTHFDLIYVTYGTVYITGGTYEGATPDWTLNCKDETCQSKEAKIEVTGGTFVGFDPANNKAEGEGTSFVPAGYVSTKGADGNFVVTEVKVAEVNGVAYATLSEAIAAANAGDTVKLLRDINTPEISYMISKSLTIDLNGMTVTGSGYDAVFQIDNADAKVVIKNGKVVAVEQSGSAGKYTMAIWASEAGCEVTLEGLDVSQKITHTDDPQMDMIYASGGTITIISGNFVSGTPAWTLNCYDASYEKGTANIIVKGGTFANFDPANNKADGKGTSFVAEGYVSNMNEDGSYTVVPKDAKITVGKRLSIGNDLTITYLVSLTGCTNPWVKFQLYNDDIKGYTTVEVKNPGTDTVIGPDGKPMDVFTFDFTGINPQRMTDTLKATVYAEDASGNVVEYQVDDYSVAQYCSNKLAKLGQNDPLRKLIGNLVAYGAAAQVYQNYRTDNLVSTVVSGAVSTDYTDRLSSVTQYTGKVLGAAGVTIKGKTLVLSNTFAVRVYFTVNKGVDIANVSFKVTANGKTDTVNSFEKDEKLGYYYFDYANLNATQLDSEVKFQSLVNGTDVGDMVTYSVNTYLAKKMPNYDKSSNAYKFMAELFNYGCACTEYASYASK